MCPMPEYTPYVLQPMLEIISGPSCRISQYVQLDSILLAPASPIFSFPAIISRGEAFWLGICCHRDPFPWICGGQLHPRFASCLNGLRWWWHCTLALISSGRDPLGFRGHEFVDIQFPHHFIHHGQIWCLHDAQLVHRWNILA